MAKAHDRVLEIVGTTANGAQTIVCTAVNYYRDRQAIADANPYAFKATFPAASASPYEITLGESNIAPPTHLRLKLTITA